MSLLLEIRQTVLKCAMKLKIYGDNGLTEDATIRKFRIVQTEGLRQVNREVIHYNLQMIIAVGFKVNNDRAVRFRKWTGQIVKDYNSGLDDGQRAPEKRPYVH